MIRGADQADIDSVIELWRIFMKDHDGMVIENNPSVEPYLIKRLDADDRFKKYISKLISSAEGNIFLAVDDENPVGYCLVRIVDNIPIFKVEKIGYINDIFVKEEFRGHSISSQLIDRTLDWFKTKGINHVSIKASTMNKDAISIYKKWGFEDYQIEMRRNLNNDKNDYKKNLDPTRERLAVHSGERWLGYQI